MHRYCDRYRLAFLPRLWYCDRYRLAFSSTHHKYYFRSDEYLRTVGMDDDSAMTAITYDDSAMTAITTMTALSLVQTAL